MSEHRAAIAWRRGEREFTYETYTRDHTWTFESGVTIDASAAPDYLGDASRVDPEESFVASAASCHMLTFLAIAARKRLVVERYEDAAVGTMEKNEDGKIAITRIVLRPKITFAGEQPSPVDIAHMHELAHRDCFIANSVRTQIDVERA